MPSDDSQKNRGREVYDGKKITAIHGLHMAASYPAFKMGKCEYRLLSEVFFDLPMKKYFSISTVTIISLTHCNHNI